MTDRMLAPYRRPLPPFIGPLSTGLAVFGLALSSALALPSGERVASGDVSFQRDGNTLIINQASGKAIVNYGSFNIGGSETVRFQQPGSSSAILNRVTDGGASRIAGSLQANGNVYLINPSGILFAPGSRVDVHGLVASGLNMSDADFKSGNMRSI